MHDMRAKLVGGGEAKSAVRLVEAAEAPQRPLPPFFLPVGGWDPLAADCSRLADALERMGVEAEARIYPRELHAFHAFVWRSRARQCWRDMIEFANHCTGTE